MNYAALPKIDKLMLLLEQELSVAEDRPLLAEAVRETVEQLRRHMQEGQLAEVDKEALLALAMQRARALYRAKSRPSLRRVLNATGIVLHTNLGRAVLAPPAVAAIHEVAQGYCNLELDLNSGKRSSRYDHVADLLCLLTGAEDALVVNNNAAAVMLALDTLARGGEAVVSRGELVEIGGSFRVPDIMARTGVGLREVGCTNKTHLSDYAAALGENTKLLLKVHPSNYKMVGFTADVTLDELVALGREHNLPVLFDLGSGCLYPLAEAGVGEEPVVTRLLKSGVDVLSFSGDKLLGGPQAGIIVGKAAYIQRMKANPLTRALRIDKFTLAALEATLRLYLDLPHAAQKIPTLQMITAPLPELQRKAQYVAAQIFACGLAAVEIADGVAETGGGSLPGEALPGRLLFLQPYHGAAQDLLAHLRAGEPALLAYIREDKAVFDVRTLHESELEEAAAAIVAALQELAQEVQ